MQWHFIESYDIFWSLSTICFIVSCREWWIFYTKNRIMG